MNAAVPAIPLAAQIAAVKREIAMRDVVYPRRIAAGKMSQALADKETATMRAVLATLESVRTRETTQ